ncbi:hypothetical protein PLICRDRAFT_42099 [Plicaturopsis crispa FD-325 SS-3]|nr:hypothetical protein PLICRDRAFT_42099 [Plicaturopsis crispa FD-325 SS-3]
MPLSFPPQHDPMLPPSKRQRRTATSVLAGDFDPRPQRDVLTSLLNNGVGASGVVETNEEARRTKRKDKKDRARERKRALATTTANARDGATGNAATPIVPQPSHKISASDGFWGNAPASSHAPDRAARPTIHISTGQRSRSISVEYERPSSPASTPGPSNSSSTSRTSSKRPRTPADGDDIPRRPSYTPAPRPPAKVKPPVKKGWKGWVVGELDPTKDSLIKLDDVPVLHERRTRSGKNFDAISRGKDDWV